MVVLSRFVSVLIGCVDLTVERVQFVFVRPHGSSIRSSSSVSRRRTRRMLQLLAFSALRHPRRVSASRPADPMDKLPVPRPCRPYRCYVDLPRPQREPAVPSSLSGRAQEIPLPIFRLFFSSAPFRRPGQFLLYVTTHKRSLN